MTEPSHFHFTRPWKSFDKGAHHWFSSPCGIPIIFFYLKQDCTTVHADIIIFPFCANFFFRWAHNPSCFLVLWWENISHDLELTCLLLWLRKDKILLNSLSLWDWLSSFDTSCQQVWVFLWGCLKSDRQCGDPWTRIDPLPLCEFSLLPVNDASSTNPERLFLPDN